ncbi:MAG: RIP metalloprotease RseP [Alistipes sp.]|nr:RIP metalloprotease RseP [Alistipes sp.]
MDILVKVVQFFLSLTLLVTVHEFGHFIVARLFKIRVEKFYIFFDWGFSLFKIRRGETEYGLGWLPLGGYCKIAGMVDESMDTEQLKSEPQPWEFRSKPAWQRFFVLIAGVSMNVLLAFLIYCGIAYTWGTSYISNDDVVYGYNFNEAAESLGFSDGDRIVSMGGEKIENIQSIANRIILADGDVEVEVLRKQAPLRFTISYDSINSVRKDGDRLAGMITLRMPFIIDSLASQSAIDAGLQRGDRIVGIDGIEEEDFGAYAPLLAERAGSSAELSVLRGADTLKITSQVSAEGKLGVMVRPLDITPRTEHYSLWEAIPAGARLTGKSIKNYWDQLKLIVKPDTGLYKQVGGFIAIGNIFPSTWDWSQFWSMTAFLSIILAIMNIIPIPGLDGGHTLFTLWEMITRRKVSDKVLEVAQYIGLILILALVIFANGNDIYRLFK